MKRITIFWILCVACTHLICAQFDARSLSSGNQQLVEDAVKNGLFVIHRTYQLQDTTVTPPANYGWDNAPDFGEVYALGIKTANGYYTEDKAVHPWKYDPKFKEYSNSRQYVPVISAGEYRHADDTAYIPMPCDDYEMREIAKDRIYLVRDSLFGNRGFSVDYSDGAKKGWLVWVVSDKPVSEQSAQKLSLSIYRAELQFEAAKEAYEIKEPASGKSIAGGFYVVPDFDEVGVIRFRLTGILHKENDRWQVVRLTPLNGELDGDRAIAPKSDKGDLTPAPDKGKKGKGLTPTTRQKKKNP
jgi:hypothetical protein